MKSYVPHKKKVNLTDHYCLIFRYYFLHIFVVHRGHLTPMASTLHGSTTISTSASADADAEAFRYGPFSFDAQLHIMLDACIEYLKGLGDGGMLGHGPRPLLLQQFSKQERDSGFGV